MVDTQAVCTGLPSLLRRGKAPRGESYPIDIDRAVKDQTFRVVALLSRASLAKPNPVKERTLALSIARQRKINFLVPLNVDGLKADELDWMTSDRAFIPFRHNWAEGFSRLLKRLNSIRCPRPLASRGAQLVSDWIAVRDAPYCRNEVLTSNLLQFTSIPDSIWRVELPKREQHLWPEDWPAVGWEEGVRCVSDRNNINQLPGL